MPIRIDAGVSVIGDPMVLAPQIWLRADRGITVATGVSSWADQSGNGNHFVQGTSIRQPLFVSNLGGRPAVHLGAPTATANAKGLVSTNLFTQPVDFEWYVVTYATAADQAAFTARVAGVQYGVTLDLSDNATFTKNYLIYTFYHATLTPESSFNAGGARGLIASFPPTDVPVLMGLRRSGTSPVGIRDASTVSVTNTTNYPTNQSMTVGNIQYNWTQPHCGGIHEVLTFNRSLTTGERMMLSRYLSARYGKVWTL